MAVDGAATPFGALLRAYRLAAGLTQEALAERAGLSARGISDLERGARRSPQRATVELLSTGLDLSLSERARLVAAARFPATTISSPYGGGPWPGRPRGVGPAPGAQHAYAAGDPPLVGRARELALLGRHLAGEGPPLLLLAGEPGIGKSRLLYEAARLGERAGWRVLSGGCTRSGDQEPYAPLASAIARAIESSPPPGRRAALAGCAWLVRLLPELAEQEIEPLPAWTLLPGQERRLLFAAVGRFLAQAAGPAGSLLVMDDLQWAGPDALTLLDTLLHASQTPVRVIGAYRYTEVQQGGTLSAWLADLAHAGLAVAHGLEPLDAIEAGELLDRLLEGDGSRWHEQREQILRRAGGVPFFLRSLTTWMRAGDHAVLPWDATQGLRQRLAALPEAAREMLGAASVAGRVTGRAVLIAITGRAPGAALAALDAACQARLLEEEGPAAYRFPHDIVREVVEGGLSNAQRAALHQRVAEVLEATPGTSLEALAFHYARSDAADKAILYLGRAAEGAAGLGAFGAAEAHYRELARRLEALDRRREAALAYARLGLLVYWASRSTSILPVVDQALRALGVVDGLRGGEAALALLDEDGAAEDRSDLYLAIAAALLLRNGFRNSLRASERAIVLARRRGEHASLAEALALQGAALLKLGRMQESLASLREAVRLGEAAGSVGLVSVALAESVWTYELLGEFGEAARCVGRALQIAEAVGDAAAIAKAVWTAGSLAFDTGDWPRTEADLARAEQLGPYLAQDPYTNCLRGILHMARGDCEAAAGYLGEALEGAQAAGTAQVEVWAGRSLAELDLLEGRPAAAPARLRALLARDEVHDTAFMLPYLALAHLHLGELETAKAVAVKAVRLAVAEENRLALPDALRARAETAIAHRDWAAAEDALDEGVALTARIGYPYAEGRLLHVYGRLHIRKDEPVAARGRLDAALTIFLRLGARKNAERAAADLAGCGTPA